MDKVDYKRVIDFFSGVPDISSSSANFLDGSGPVFEELYQPSVDATVRFPKAARSLGQKIEQLPAAKEAADNENRSNILKTTAAVGLVAGGVFLFMSLMPLYLLVPSVGLLGYAKAAMAGAALCPIAGGAYIAQQRTDKRQKQLEIIESQIQEDQRVLDEMPEDLATLDPSAFKSHAVRLEHLAKERGSAETIKELQQVSCHYNILDTFQQMRGYLQALSG